MKKMRSTIVIQWLLLISLLGFAQNIQLDFLQMGNQRIVAYYATASGMDSVDVVLDKKGKGTLFIDNDYEGLIQVGNASLGMIEMLYSPKEQAVLQTPASSTDLSGITIRNSPENDFLRTTLSSRASIMQQLQWIAMGKQLYASSTALQTMLNDKQQTAEQEMETVVQQMNDSQLSAPRYIRLMDYVQQLAYAQQARDGNVMNELKNEMETWLDIDALSRSLSLQDQVFRGYLNIYLAVQNGEAYYAESILTTLNRLEEPLRLFYIKNSLMVCTQVGWKGAEDKILGTVLAKWSYYLETTDSKLKRMIDAYKLQFGKVELKIEGLSENETKYNKTLLFFYESDCMLCLQEIEVLKKKYKQLQKQGIRIVSISADRDRTLFDTVSKEFPWQDKLCDLKGAMGTNYSRFGIQATPNYVLLDGEQMFEDRFMRLDDKKLIDYVC